MYKEETEAGEATRAILQLTHAKAYITVKQLEDAAEYQDWPISGDQLTATQAERGTK